MNHYVVNNRVVGVAKPDGSVTTTVYDNKQRVTSTVERTATGAVITGFEYTYDDLSRIIEEKVLANSTKMCYTYDNLNRVTKRTIKNLSNVVLSEETFTYDAAGNVTDAPESCFQYDTNNRLIVFNGNTVSYDLDGNMLSGNSLSCTYDSANRLVSAGGHTYTYNAENVRIRNLCQSEDTTYTYDVNCKLSRLLCKTTNSVTTKYVYGRGLIGEEVSGAFKTYHFDSRGSTIAITDASGNITDTFAYDTYGKLLSRTGTSKVIFGYNGRDGVVTDDNGLIYMRARYYSPEMRRFINADIVAGKISNAITLNRFAYANGNPAMYIDPSGLIGILATLGILAVIGFGLSLSGDSKQEKSNSSNGSSDVVPADSHSTVQPQQSKQSINITSEQQARILRDSGLVTDDEIPPQYSPEPSIKAQYLAEQEKKKAQENPPKTESELDETVIFMKEKAWEQAKDQIIDWGATKMDDCWEHLGNLLSPDNPSPSVYITNATNAFSATQTIYDTYNKIVKNYKNGESTGEIISDAVITAGSGALSLFASMKIGAAVGTVISPGMGTLLGLGIGLAIDCVAWELDNLFYS